jgi:hypothetical protein
VQIIGAKLRILELNLGRWTCTEYENSRTLGQKEIESVVSMIKSLQSIEILELNMRRFSIYFISFSFIIYFIFFINKLGVFKQKNNK